MSLNTIYKLSDKQVSTSLSGESVVLNHEKGSYYSLNEVGTFIWNMLEKGASSKGDLKEKVLERFNVEDEECESDLSTLIEDLINEGLVEEA